MTLPEIIYDIKRTISGGDTTSDSKFLDTHLTKVVNQARAEALSVHYMQMREKRALSEAQQDFLVLQNSKAFNTEHHFTSTDDLESNSGNSNDSGSVLYRRLKKYAIEASEGSVYQWDRSEFNEGVTTSGSPGKVSVTDVCRFTLPSPILKFGRNSGFLSFTDHSYDALQMHGTDISSWNYYTAPQLGGDHVKVVYGLKELRDLQKHKASFPYKRGFRTQPHNDSIIRSQILFNVPETPQRLVSSTAEKLGEQWISFKNPLAVVTNSDIFLNGPDVSTDWDLAVEADAATSNGGWDYNEYFQKGGQYDYTTRRKDVVLLIDSPLGKHLIDDTFMNVSMKFGTYLVTGIFADPTLLPNYNFIQSEYPIPEELLPGLKQNLIANQLMIARRIEEDRLNDGNDTSRDMQQNVQPRQQAAGRQRRKS